MRVDSVAGVASSERGGADLGLHDPNELPSGMWGGQTVQLVAKVFGFDSDAAEEVSMMASEKSEESKIEERDIAAEEPVDVPGLEEIQNYLEATAQEDIARKLKDFVDALISNQERHGQSDARQEVESRFGGPSEQFAALSYATHELRRRGHDETLLEQVHGALEDVHDDFKDRIQKREETARFQAAYRDAVLGGDSLGSMLKGALDQSGGQDYRTAVSVLIRALGNDVSCFHGTGASPARMHAVLQELYLMEVLCTLLDGCERLGQRMGNAHGITLESGRLMQDIVTASGERPVTGSRFASIADKHGASDLQPKIEFLNATKALVRDMPVKVFADANARINAVGAVQEALDNAIAKEDEQ